MQADCSVSLASGCVISAPLQVETRQCAVNNANNILHSRTAALLVYRCTALCQSCSCDSRVTNWATQASTQHLCPAATWLTCNLTRMHILARHAERQQQRHAHKTVVTAEARRKNSSRSTSSSRNSAFRSPAQAAKLCRLMQLPCKTPAAIQLTDQH